MNRPVHNHKRDPLVQGLRAALEHGLRQPEDEGDDRRTPTGADVDRATHGFHTWPAGLHPDTARDLLGLIPPGKVCDPFCGGGTVLVEAMLAGRRAMGRDLSPIAVKVARARTALVDPQTLTRFRSAARRAADKAKKAEELPSADRQDALRPWYQAHVACELESLRHSTAKSPQDIRFLMEACLSSIVVKASLRESDTRARKVKRQRPPGTTAILFHKKARELARRLEALRDAVPEGAPMPDVREGDARDLHVAQPLAGVLTSPPYPGVYDYLPMQLLRHVWLGLRPDDKIKREIGSRRAFRHDSRQGRRSWRKDTERWMWACTQALEPGGRLIVVIGDGQIGRKVLGSVEPSVEAAAAVGLTWLARASVALPNTDPARQEHVLLFERPAAG